MTGVYQSIGQLSKLENGISTYRIITDLKGLSYRDYEIARGPGGSATVRPLGSGPRRLCEDKKLALPMLSKDGKLLSAVDLVTNTTKIFEVDGGKCEEKIDLGMFTSKVDFSYDKKKITFHKMANEKAFNPDHPYTRVPSDDYVSNIYVYDLENGDLSRLTNNTDSNAVYPAFRRDGKVTFIQHPHQGGEKKNSNLITADPAGARKVSLDHFLPKSAARPDQDERLKSFAALGGLWSQLCSPYGENLSMESAVVATFNLDPDRCRQMVRKYWEGFKKGVGETKSFDSARFKADTLEKLSVDKLIEACPKQPANPASSPPPTAAPSPRPVAAAGPVPVSCRHCHRAGTRFPIPFEDAAGLRAARPTSRSSRAASLAEEIINRVRGTTDDYRMPPPDEDTPMSAEGIARRLDVASVHGHRLRHHRIELAEEVVDFFDRGFAGDQPFHILAEMLGKLAAEEDFTFEVLVHDLVAARGKHGVLAVCTELDNAVVVAVVDHLHGAPPGGNSCCCCGDCQLLHRVDGAPGPDFKG